MLLLTKIWDPQSGNPRDTLLKQTDQNRIGPHWAEMWTISGENVGRSRDPYVEPTFHMTHMKQVDKNCMGPIWVAHMGLI